MIKLRKIWGVALVLMLASGVGAFAESYDLDTMEKSFSDFSSDIATSLPFASTTGLNWSDATVRGFPHFGAGLSFEVAMMSNDAFKNLEDLGLNLPSEVSSDAGVPFPGYAVDARLGIPVLPIDVGAKLGVVTQGMSDAISGATGVDLDYTLAGFDVRYALLKGNLLLPSVAVSAGYNYLSGGITTKLQGVDDNSISGTTGGKTYTIVYKDPELRFNWKSQNMDFKVQASKGLLIFTPHLGLGYTYGWSEAGGGIRADVDKDASSNISDIESAYDVSIDSEGFEFISSSSGGAFRAFVGTQVNLTIFKLDLNAKYNFNTQKFGGGINARIQI